MVGLPSIFTFGLYAGLYPVFPDMHSAPINPQYQHWMLLVICFWLVTVGPCPQGLFQTIYAFFVKCCSKPKGSSQVEQDKKDK